MMLNSLKSGFIQVINNKRLVLVFFLANLFFGLLVMLPFRAILSDFIGNSLMGAKLGGNLDMDFLFEFFKYKSSTISVVQSLIFFGAIVYWLFNLFLSGGAFKTFVTNEKYKPSSFWAGCAKYFGRFIRIILWSLPVFAILFCLQFLETFFEKIFYGSDPYQNITFWGGWIKMGLRYISFLLFWMVIDYARIYAVLNNDERRMRIAVWQGIRFTFSNLHKTFTLSFLLFILGIVVLVIYNPIADLLSAPSVVVILLLFLWQQFYMIFRMMLRLTLYSSQFHFFQSVEESKMVLEPDFDTELGTAGNQV